MRRIFAQTRKELTQIVRDYRTLALALALPLVLLLLLGSAISLTVANLPIVVQDLDHTPASQQYIDAFRASVTFHVVAWPDDRHPEDALTANKARAALIIPGNFGRDMARGVASPVQLLVDGSDSNTARLISGDASQITQAFNRSMGGATRAQPVVASMRLWYNPGRSSKKFYGPGIFVLGISMFPPLLASLAMAKEGEQKTILQVYVSSISAHEFLLGKIFAFMIVALGEASLMLILLFTYFGLNLAGDPTPFLVATVLYAFCVASFGIMVGAAIPTLVDIALEGAPNRWTMAGFILAILAIWLITLPEPTNRDEGDQKDSSGRPAGVGMAALAGVGFAGFYLCVHQATGSAVSSTARRGRIFC